MERLRFHPVAGRLERGGYLPTRTTATPWGRLLTAGASLLIATSSTSASQALAQSSSREILTVAVTDSLDVAAVDIVSSQVIGRVGLERISATEAVLTVSEVGSGNERISGMRAGGLLTGLSVHRGANGADAEIRLSSSQPAIFQIASSGDSVELVFCTKARHLKNGCPRPAPTVAPADVASSLVAAAASTTGPTTGDDVAPSASDEGEQTPVDVASNPTPPGGEPGGVRTDSAADTDSPSAAVNQNPSPVTAPADRQRDVSVENTPGDRDEAQVEGREQAVDQRSDAAVIQEPRRVDPAPPDEVSETQAAEQPRVARGLTTTRVSLRASPSLSGRRLAVLSPGVELIIRGESGLWLEIETATGDLAGWVYGAYVDVVATAE